MIWYINHATKEKGIWKRTSMDFTPRADDFKKIYFQIDGVAYFRWDKEFETALIWEKLKGI